MAVEVRVEHVESRPIAAVRRRARVDQLPSVIPEACGEVWKFIRSSQIPHSGLNVVVYFDNEMNLECGVIVDHAFTGEGSVTCSQIPAGIAATATHVGPYNRLKETYDTLLEWCRDQGYTLKGPSWEIYGHWNDDPSQLRTDVFWLLEDVSSETLAN